MDEEPQETLLTARGGQAEEDRMVVDAEIDELLNNKFINFLQKDSVQSEGQKKTFSICGKKFNLPTCLGGCRSCFQKGEVKIPFYFCVMKTIIWTIDSVDEEPQETPLTVIGGQAEKEKVVVDAEIEEVDKEEVTTYLINTFHFSKFL